jgi:hypothetical protein
MTLVQRLAPFVLLLLATVPLAAQVGIDPSRSPYRDIRPGTTFEGFGGMVLGSGGPIPVGPRDGPLFGLRALLRANSTISLGFGGWGALTKRTVIDPTNAPDEQETGEVDHELVGVEALIQLNATGGKTWRGFAPFGGVGIGLVKAGATDDAFGYEFGTKFYFAPVLGTRIFLAERMYLRLEARGLVWKVRYPATYALEPTDDPGTAEDPHAVNPSGRTGQYILAPTLGFGIGIAF